MNVSCKELVLDGFEISSMEDVRKLYAEEFFKKFPREFYPTRFVVTESGNGAVKCEFDVVDTTDMDSDYFWGSGSIFDFKKREYEDNSEFNVVLMVPTGVDACIGGHCGDANAMARLVGSTCDNLILHPNVVNAADYNEMTENSLYVEGSVITRLMMGQIGLQRVNSNRVLLLMDKHSDRYFNNEVINAVSTARVTLGLDCDVLEMDDIIHSKSLYSDSGRATGAIENLERLFAVIDSNIDNYDAIALSTFIKVPAEYHEKYFKDEELVNPWGGIEAMITHSVVENYKIPCAHAPIMSSRDVMDLDLGIVEPRKAPESASVTYLHCLLKGMHKSPRVVPYDKGLNAENISCMIIPDGCLGLPVIAAMEHGIPVIAVSGNVNRMNNDLNKLAFKPGKFFRANNYLEAVGIMNALKAGISIDSVVRPMGHTKLLKETVAEHVNQ